MKTRHVVPSSIAFIAAAVCVMALSLSPLPGYATNKGHSPICLGIGRVVAPSRCLLDRTKRSDAVQLTIRKQQVTISS